MEDRTLMDGDVAVPPTHGHVCGCAGCGSGRALSVQIVDMPRTSSSNLPASQSGFDISLVFTSTLSTEVLAAINVAVARWEQIILADIPDANGIDDLQITVRSEAIDGLSGTLAYAGPTHIREGSMLPIKGQMVLDTADLSTMVQNGAAADVVFHEIGHALGFGGLWRYMDLVGGSSTDPRFLGEHAAAAYQLLGGQGQVPLEATGGSGTSSSHWRESVFGDELMTGWINYGTSVVSTVTIAALRDMGYTVDLSQAQAFSLDSSNIPAQPFSGTIRGTLFEDANRNGTRDPNEYTLSGRTVYLDTNQNGQLDTGEQCTVSLTDGTFVIRNVAQGTYLVRQVVPSNLVSTTPPRTVTISTTNESASLDFGSAMPMPTVGTLSGTVFNDLNRNGQRDTAEPVTSNRIVFLDSNNNAQLDTGERIAITNTLGQFSFVNLPLAQYRVRAVLPTGHVLTTTLATADLTQTANVSGLVIGQHLPPPPQNSSITGTVFVDSNRNGLRDTTESGASSRTLFIDTNNNGLLDSTETRVTSNSLGQFRFANLAAGFYRIRQVLPAGHTQILPRFNGFYSVSLGTAQTLSNLTFASSPPLPRGVISGTVYFDRNRNATRESTESGFSGVQIVLDLNNNGRLDSTDRITTTSTTGLFTFTGLNPGTYRIFALPSSSFQLTTPQNLTTTAATTTVSSSPRFGISLRT
jgi:SdrD B-like domain/Leishmanolysin